MRVLYFVFIVLRGILLQAQTIQFDQGNWQVEKPEHQQRVVTVMANEERVDSVYTEDLETGELKLVIQRYPLSRYEYYPGYDPFPALFRRVDIRQQEIVDSAFVESVETGEMVMTVQRFIKDIPNGAYHEFFPDGNIRIKGTLDGYNADGSLKKTGEWLEWGASGKVIRQEIYP